jgi:hypothetical protein
LVTAGAALALSGCSGSHHDPTAAAVTPEQPAPGVTAAPHSDPDPLQAEILADGTVTMGEMERALLAVVSCVKADGFEARLDRFDLQHGHSFTVSSADGDNASADRSLMACEDRMLSGVIGPFVRDNGPSQTEIEAKGRRTLQCLAADGYDVEGLDVSEAAEIVDPFAFARCDAGS